MTQLKPVNPDANDCIKELLIQLNNASNSKKAICGAFKFIGNPKPFCENNFDLITERYSAPALFSTYYPCKSDESWEFLYKDANRDIIKEFNSGKIILVHNQNEWADNLCERICGKDGDKTDFMMNFDAENDDKNMEAYEFYLKCREQWADALEELKNAGVSVMYRPFVEMNNPFFFGSFTESAEGCAAFKRIWKQLTEYLFVERGLNNILLTYSPSAPSNDGRSDLYFPGEDYVDVVAPTAYTAPWEYIKAPEIFFERALHYSRHASLVPNKPFGFAELGVSLDRDEKSEYYDKGNWRELLEIKEKCPRMGFFCLWCDTNGPVADTSIFAEEFMNKKEWIYLKDFKG